MKLCQSTLGNSRALSATAVSSRQLPCTLGNSRALSATAVHSRPLLCVLGNSRALSASLIVCSQQLFCTLEEFESAEIFITINGNSNSQSHLASKSHALSSTLKLFQRIWTLLRPSPPITRSIACSKWVSSTLGIRYLAAMRAASLHTLAMSAPAIKTASQQYFS